MTIHVYHCPTAPEKRRYIAQSDEIKGQLFLTIHGPTEDVARQKLQIMLDYQNTEPKDRKAFNLRGKLAALGVTVDFEDLL